MRASTYNCLLQLSNELIASVASKIALASFFHDSDHFNVFDLDALENLNDIIACIQVLNTLLVRE
jgi:hypothetical protein